MADDTAGSVTVSIFDRTYTFAATAEQPAEHIRAVAAHLDQGMRQVQGELKPNAPLHTAILAALRMIDELWQLQDDYDQAESAIEQRTSRLADSLGRIFQHSATAAEPD
jgi:cell division protein ZapA (FtsZ GTPase activity inhibitor)